MTLLLLILAPAFQDDFAVAPGKTEALRCTVKRARALFDDAPGTILQVAVRNGGAVSAEPLAFEIRLRGSKTPETVERVAWPWHGRGGRAVAPGKTVVYPVLVPRPRGELRGARLRVTAASFFRGRTIDTPVDVVRLRHDTRKGALGAAVPVTTATVRNRLERAVDAVFLATCRRPFDGRTLVRRRVEPGEHDIEIADLPTGASSYEGARVTRLQLVDWSVVRDRGSAAAAARVRAAVAGWRRWPGTAPAFGGRFLVDGAEGTFVVRGGDLTVQGGGATARRSLETLFGFVRDHAPPPEHATRTVHGPWIGFDGPGLLVGGTRYQRIAVEDGRIVGAEAQPGVGRERWETRPAGAGYVVAAIDHDHAGTHRNYRWEYAEVASLHVPIAYTETWSFQATGNQRVTRVRLFDVRVADAEPRAAPAGPGVDALRSAWEAGHRHPRPRPTRTVRIRVRAPASHAEWQGVAKVEVDARLVGDRVDAEATDARLAPVVRETLAMLVTGRLLMWRGVDFGRRGDFDEVFAGARIDAAADGTHAVHDGPVRFVEVRDGRVAALGLHDGRVRRFGWRRVGGTWVVDTVTQGHEEFRVRYRAAGVPTRIEIRDRFGPDWGVEVLEIADR